MMQITVLASILVWFMLSHGAVASHYTFTSLLTHHPT